MDMVPCIMFPLDSVVQYSSVCSCACKISRIFVFSFVFGGVKVNEILLQIKKGVYIGLRFKVHLFDI